MARPPAGDQARLRLLLDEHLSSAISDQLRARGHDVVTVVEAGLAGMTDEDIAAAAQRAKDRKMPGKYILSLQNTTQQPALAFLRGWEPDTVRPPVEPALVSVLSSDVARDASARAVSSLPTTGAIT